jgi:hypothetical protein
MPLSVPPPSLVPTKRPYASPTLVAYGSLAELTQGQFFSRVDGESGRNGNGGQGRGQGRAD